MKQRVLTFLSHVRAHGAVVANEFWYDNGPLMFANALIANETPDDQ
jgi:hypothetical protein